ncbi:MAG: hypothetical protein ABIT37_25170 [Luteolibacter sp.]
MDVKTLFTDWDARQEIFEKRFNEHFPKSDDLLTTVLKGHLLVEELLDTINRHCFHFPKYYDEANLPFSKKILIARAQVLVPNPEFLFGALIALNELRNNLAHNLDSPAQISKIQRFVTFVEKRYSQEHLEGFNPLEFPIERRVGSALSYLLGTLGVLDNFVEFMEKMRQYGPSEAEQTSPPSSHLPSSLK